MIGRLGTLLVVVVFAFVQFRTARADTDNGNAPEIVVVIGASGNDEYAKDFLEWVEDWKRVAIVSNAKLTTIGHDDDRDSKAQLQQWLTERSAESEAPLWMVMIGHGTFANDLAKFNLNGPDVTSAELAGWLNSIDRPLVVVNCASASGPFVNRLSAPNRIVVTATKSGSEQNFARFGKYFAAAVASPDTDLDHDDEVSVQEAFLKASDEVKRFYDSESRIATEHALVDDNGDGKGTPAKMFRGIRPIANAKDGSAIDGVNAMRMTLSPSGERLQLTVDESNRRDEIETELDRLRLEKSKFSDEDYFSAIEPWMIELARIYRDAEQRRVK
ncbi:hypothetical protein Poly51_47220 [Rubripirellula tenax]|uniref:Caspase domain protein n=1 Tax=Rubripirellula tenax TaxID=2528015 RepID=A0A5C6EJ40_9BACT|nr:hypothetical protein [Rubripirellula tenax]TWU48818.1 hypothetical protein Poly51_47220 [Rubripirellula tenax]